MDLRNQLGILNTKVGEAAQCIAALRTENQKLKAELSDCKKRLDQMPEQDLLEIIGEILDRLNVLDSEEPEIKVDIVESQDAAQDEFLPAQGQPETEELSVIDNEPENTALDEDDAEIAPARGELDIF